MSEPASDTIHGDAPSLVAPAHTTGERARRYLPAAVCVALFIAVRCLALDADTPTSIGGTGARELYAEPPAKSHEARNYAMFGAFKLNPVDNYQFWRAQSPAWVYPLAGFFKVFGVDYPQLRTFSTLYAALGLGLLLSIAHGLMRPAVVVFIGLVVALEPVYFHTARVGFLEPAVTTWLTLSLLALLRAERDARWLCVAMLAFVLAFFTKQAAAYAFPLIAVAVSYRLWRAGRNERWIAVSCALVLGAASALYVAKSDYARTVEHNVKHMVRGDESNTEYRLRGLGTLIDRVYDPERHAHVVATLPITGPIALLNCLAFAACWLRRRRLPSYRELVLLGWFACAVLATSVIARSGLRFWTLTVPPAALIAGWGVERALRALEHRTPVPLVRHLPLAVPLIAMLLWSASGHASFLGGLQYTVRDGARQLCEHIGPRDATVVGFPSPGIVLGTPYKNFYMRTRFNSKRKDIAKLGVTHLLMRATIRDTSRNIIKRAFPKLLKTERPVKVLNVRGEVLNLFDVEGKLTASDE